MGNLNLSGKDPASDLFIFCKLKFGLVIVGWEADLLVQTCFRTLQICQLSVTQWHDEDWTV